MAPSALWTVMIVEEIKGTPTSSLLSSLSSHYRTHYIRLGGEDSSNMAVFLMSVEWTGIYLQIIPQQQVSSAECHSTFPFYVQFSLRLPLVLCQLLPYSSVSHSLYLLSHRALCPPLTLCPSIPSLTLWKSSFFSSLGLLSWLLKRKKLYLTGHAPKG